MPLIRSSIGADGPVIDLGTWVGRAAAHGLIARGSTVPPPSTIRALIDTGADLTVIHPNALAAIGSSASGRVQVRRVSTGKRFRWVDLHKVRLAFGGIAAPPARTAWINLSVAAAVPADPRILALVGRDMLAHCRFVYDGLKRDLLVVY